MKHKAVKQSTKLITFLNSECYWPSGILIYLQSSYAPRSWQCTGHREAQSHEPVNKGKYFPVFLVDVPYGVGHSNVDRLHIDCSHL
jgi:hypothetical protein